MMQSELAPATSRARGWIIAIVMTGIALRIAAALPYSMHHPDEMVQYVEQAYRLSFGYGVVPWEYRYGMRSWVVPLILSGPMQLGVWIAPETDLHLILPRMLVIALSMGILWAAYRLGAKASRLHGLIALFVAAIWFETVYFSAHTLTEMMAAACVLPAAAIVLTDKTPSFRRMMVAGMLLGAASVLRFHYLPAIGILVLLSAKWAFPDRWLPMAIGGLLILAVSASVDMAMGQIPFGWLVENFKQNIIHDRASGYGTDVPLAYIGMMKLYWQFAIIPVFLLMIPGVRREPVLFWVAIVNLGVHMMIGHKEYRFIILTTTIFAILAAIGSVDVFRWIIARIPALAKRSWIAPVVLTFAWSSLSITLALTQPVRSLWNGIGNGLEIARLVAHSPKFCAIGMYQISYWETGGYSHLQQRVPLYLTTWMNDDQVDAKGLASVSASFNALIAPQSKLGEIPANFQTVQCTGHRGPDPWGVRRPICLFVRKGGCDPEAATHWEIQTVLKRNDS